MYKFQVSLPRKLHHQNRFTGARTRVAKGFGGRGRERALGAFQAGDAVWILVITRLLKHQEFIALMPAHNKLARHCVYESSTRVELLIPPPLNSENRVNAEQIGDREHLE